MDMSFPQWGLRASLDKELSDLEKLGVRGASNEAPWVMGGGGSGVGQAESTATIKLPGKTEDEWELARKAFMSLMPSGDFAKAAALPDLPPVPVLPPSLLPPAKLPPPPPSYIDPNYARTFGVNTGLTNTTTSLPPGIDPNYARTHLGYNAPGSSGIGFTVPGGRGGFNGSGYNVTYGPSSSLGFGWRV